MKRREFIMLLGGAAVARPLVARAQQPKMPVVGYIGSTAEADAPRLRAFRQGLGEGGYVEGRNVAIEYRGTGNVGGRGAELAADLVRHKVSLQQPTKYEFVINLKTAKALGLDISPALLSVADDLIE
jgi:putative ABC transport system substrate-binding protein